MMALPQTVSSCLEITQTQIPLLAANNTIMVAPPQELVNTIIMAPPLGLLAVSKIVVIPRLGLLAAHKIVTVPPREVLKIHPIKALERFGKFKGSLLRRLPLSINYSFL